MKCAPVQQEDKSIGFAVHLVSDLQSVRVFVNPIIHEVTNVDVVLVLQYHVVENTSRVQDISNQKNVVAWQWNIENLEPILQHSKYTFNRLAHGLTPVHST